jgi:hypothetical protein
LRHAPPNEELHLTAAAGRVFGGVVSPAAVAGEWGRSVAEGLAMLKFSHSFGTVSAQKISALEKRLGVKFPADYKRFLRSTNGGCPEPNCFTVPDRGDALVGILYGIRNERDSCDLEYEQEQATLWDPLPKGLVAIGNDPGGCLLLLSTVGKNPGRVFFWDRKGFWVRKDGHNTFPVAASFAEFLDSLHDLPAEG